MAGSLILRWVMRHKALTAAMVAILALTVALMTSRMALAFARAEGAQSQAREQVLEHTIQSWKRSYETSHEQALAAQKKLATLQKKHRRLEQDLAAAVVPEKCEDAVRWGNETVLDLTRSW